jgi:hypothetical protein
MRKFESIEQLLPCEIRKIIQHHKRVKARVETLRRKKIRVRNQWRTA